MQSSNDGSPDGPGLTNERATELRAVHGPNQILPEPERHGWRRILAAAADPMVLLLAAVAAVEYAVGQRRDASIALAAILPIAGMDVYLERRSESALEALRRLTVRRARVWRDGTLRELPAEGLVPGDRILLWEGDLVPADGRLVSSTDLQVDESALTGESEPVAKWPDASGASRLFAGTTVLAGRGTALVETTGPRTEYGKIARLVAGVADRPTPLQRLLKRFVTQLVGVAVVFCLAVVAVERMRGAPWGEAFVGGLVLAMAALPEEFPVVFTLFLSLGAFRLARRRALVRELAAVETLGAATVVCVDKTGTLTEGRLDVAYLLGPDGRWHPTDGPPPPWARQALEAFVLASEPEPYDPIDQALARLAEGAGVSPSQLHAEASLLREHPFDPKEKYHTHVWRTGDSVVAFSKGAPETILRKTLPGRDRDRVRERWDELLAEGSYRWIAVARGQAALDPSAGRKADEATLRMLALVAFQDPPRPTARQAVAASRTAGIRVVMITGDHPATALAVARDVGLEVSRQDVMLGEEAQKLGPGEFATACRRVRIFARATPELKHRIVEALAAQGETVAMTGDGINDAPALRAASIGIAMGKRGTEVAREASKLVLLDDDFATFVEAIREGRKIFDDIRNAFRYLLAVHIPIVLLALLPPVLGWPLLLLPAEIVWIELLVHPTASLVFPFDPRPEDLMRRPSRRARSTFFGRGDLARTLALGLTATAVSLAAFALALAAGPEAARGAGMTTLVLCFAGLIAADRLRRLRGPASNPALLPALAGTLATLAVALAVSGIRAVLHMALPPPHALAAALGLGGAFWLLAHLLRPPTAPTGLMHLHHAPQGETA